MIKLLSTGIYILIDIIGLCSPLPIPAVQKGQDNIFLLGALVFVTFGSILAGCVCCLRRKKGFQPNKEKDPKEFTNESENQRHGVPSIAITEATGSTNSTRSTTPAAVVVSIPVVNNSHENLIIEANDNNNGPISAADLENIENNNAYGYIENQNEIVIISEPTCSRIPSSTSGNQSLDYNNEIVTLTSLQNQIPINNIQYQNENIKQNNNIDKISNNQQKNMPNNDIINQVQINALQDIVIKSTINDINDSKLGSSINLSNNNTNDITVILSSEENYENCSENLHSNTIINAEIHSTDEKDKKLNQLEYEHNQQNINSDNANCLITKNVQENVPIFMKYQEDRNNLTDNNFYYDNLNVNFINSSLLNKENQLKPKNTDIIVSEILMAGLEDKGDTDSIKSLSSEKSNEFEINSVEEALRALDIAIEGDMDDDNDDIVENDENKQLNEITCEDNTVKRKSIEINNENYIENVRIEAEELVDSVLNDRKKIVEIEAIKFVDSLLNESKKIIEDLDLDESNINLNQTISTTPTSPPPSSTQTIAVNYFTIQTNNICPNDILINSANDFDEMMLMKQKQKTQKQQQQIKTELHTNTTMSFKQKLAEQFDDFFANGVCVSSTPSIKNNVIYKNNEYINKKCSIKLKFNDESPTNDLCTLLSPIEDIALANVKQNVNANETYNTADATFNVADAKYNDANKTYDADHKNNETFDINKAFDLDPLKDEFTYPGDPCTSKQAMERDQFLRPLIKYQREEVTSDELNTITPVNTPIELNYNQETWDKMTKPNDDELKSGWFLHPQELLSDNQCLGDDGTVTKLDNENFIANGDETYDVDEEDSRNLESTFEALRKQLAEVLPQPQGMAGPPEFSDDEDQHSNRTFDEYRSPLDGIFGLLEIDSTTTPQLPAQNNEVVINYNNKRPLSPIIEESEEETCKTFVLNETKCLDSTSTGCIETGEAIMGVTKTLMASNDTLFNFEDTLGDKEDVFSPRVSSRSDSQATTPVKTSGKSSSTANSSAATISSSDTEKVDDHNDLTYVHSTTPNAKVNQQQSIQPQHQREPPKTLNFVDINELKSDNDFCSPDQQKTFSEGTSTSTTTDRLSSSLSPTLDNETTFTLNTVDDKTCITVVIKDDERISEISEPEWGGSTTSCGAGVVNIVGTGYEMNSLTDIPSLDFNVNTFDKEFETNEKLNSEIKIECYKIIPKDIFEEIKTNIDDDENTDNGNDEIAIDDDIDVQKDSGHDDSGHSTQASTDKSNNTSHNISAQETDSIEDDIKQYNHVLELNTTSANNILNIVPKNMNGFTVITNDKKENCKEFLKNEIEFSSNLENTNRSRINNINLNVIETNDDKKILNTNKIANDSLKENSDPNIKVNNKLANNINNVVINNGFDEKITSYQKVVQINNCSQDNVINDKINNITSELLDKEHYSINGGNGIDFYQEKTKTDVFVPQVEYNKIKTNQQEQISPTSSPLLLKNTNNYNYGGSSNDEIIAHLCGEEDPWAETLNDIHFTGPGSTDMLSNSSEWDSDVDDSHSSEEFMYVRGNVNKPADDSLLNVVKDEGKSIITDKCINDNKKMSFKDNLMIKDVKEHFESNLWPSHKENIHIGILKGTLMDPNVEDEIASESSSSELEGEFIPSCWDSMAMPARSALKSPDKTNSSSEEDSQGENKKCRSVVFKKQRYHSVYEYPRESASLSPCGPHLWQNKNYVFKIYDDDNTIEKFNDDGFVISSSSRPFHGSQFNALCHTWPTDSDFSWSQNESHEKFGEDDKKLTAYSDIDLKWNQPILTNDEIVVIDGNKSDDNHRPDSGVGESAEMLSDRQSLGELCHTKTKLRLPIEEKLVLPTSSCTGSMDSLSSSSSINSEIQQQINQQQQELVREPEKFKLNFSTFGKRNSFNINDNEKKLNDNFDKQKQNDIESKYDKLNNRPAINLILIDETNNTKLIQNSCNENFNSSNNLMKTDKIKQSDSTDEDSGIESIMRINKIDEK